ADQALLARHFSSVRNYFQHQGRAWTLHDFFSTFAHGWSFERLKPYFFRDWSDTEEARAIAALVRAAVVEHAADEARRDRPLALLGCGAGGLLRDLAGLYPESYGLDLALPSLALVRHLLDGGELEMHLHNHDPSTVLPWESRAVTLHGSR